MIPLYQDTFYNWEGGAFTKNGDDLVCCSSRLSGNVWDGSLRLFRRDHDVGKFKALGGHQMNCGVHSVAWVTDSKTFVCAADDGKLHLMEVNDNDHGLTEFSTVRHFTAHDDVLTSVEVQETTKVMASSGFDGYTYLWSAAREYPLGVLTPDESSLSNPLIWDVKWLQSQLDSLVSSHQDGFVRVWDTRSTAKPMLSFQNECASTALGVHTEKGLFCGLENGHVVSVDLRKVVGTEVTRTIPVHKRAVQSICCDGIRIITGGDDGAVYLFDIDQETTEPKLLVSHKDYVRDVKLVPKSRIPSVLSCSWDGMIHIASYEP